MNPVQPMVEAFLDIYSSLPTSFLALLDLSLILFVAVVALRLLNGVR